MKNRLTQIIKTNFRQILLVFLAFLIMVLVSSFYVTSIVRGQVETIGMEVMKTTQTRVAGSLTETRLVFDSAVQTVQDMVIAGKTNYEILAYLTETNERFSGDESEIPDFMRVYAYVRGDFLDGAGWTPPDDFSAPSRPWFVGAVKSGGEIYFSDPYVDADTGGMRITYSRALLSPEKGIYGVVAIDLNLNRITEYVASQQTDSRGYGILVSDTMQIIMHEDKALIGKQMSDVSSDYAKLAARLAPGQELIAGRFTDLDGTDSVAFFCPIFDGGWHIGSFMPRSSYYSQVQQMVWVLAAIGMALMIILSSFLVRLRMDKLRADEESRSKSNFLARMSHEMRTPMNAIIGMTEIARATDDPEKVKYSLSRINEAAMHLLGLINDVLDMSKIEANKFELSESAFALANMVSRLQNVMGLKFEARGQSFKIEVDPETPENLFADEQRLTQVIMNLLSNANKFTPEGGNIELKISCPEQDGERCTLRISVSDDGIGLSDEQRSRLFHSFEQADNSISRRFGGSGLGLVISKSIVEMMDGDISVESRLGEGATFTVNVRAGVSEAVETGAAASAPSNYDGIFAGKHILLAEDVAINREIVLTLLAPTGVDIDCAENGREAIDMFAGNSEKYDLIFMDIHMPEVDGYEAARQIRATDRPRAGSIPIVAMTADVFREDVLRAESAGMNGHVGKPIDLGEVIAIMRKFIAIDSCQPSKAD